MVALVTLAVLCLCWASLGAAKSTLHFRTLANGGFEIGTQTPPSSQPRIYFNSAHPFFTSNGNTYSIGTGNLTTNHSTTTTGTDRLGQWKSISWQYSLGGSVVEIAIKTYGAAPFVIWSQKFVSGLKNPTSKTFDHTISGFPSLQLVQHATLPLGFLSFEGLMVGDTEKKFGVFGPQTLSLRGGMDGSGPLAVFDKSGNAFVFSPFSNFMTASNWEDKARGTLSWGVMSGASSLPAGYESSTILYYSADGINKAFEGWGKTLRTYYNKTTTHREKDLSLNYVGYWTDNGAYYYYHTEPQKNYGQTLIDVKKYLDYVKFPAKYIQLDSWWYPKDSHGAVTTWDAMPSVFPQGLVPLSKSIGLPFVAHNRYWSPNTTYAKQNGGQFHFVKEDFLSLPDDKSFWEYLFTESVKWGLIVYEQDWLNYQIDHTTALKTDPGLGKRWLTQMGQAAEDHKLTIQYCMALSRETLQSLEISTVTQARASTDYHLLPDQWKIGVSGLFADAVGVAPSKDTFWTTSVQDGNPYRKVEPNPELQALVSVLSTGPVGPGDMIGGLNVSMMMQCCRSDGYLLQPSKPPTAVDDQIIESAFKDGSGGVHGEVWSTYSDIQEYRFGLILTAFLTKPYTITQAKAGLHRNNDKYQNLAITPVGNTPVIRAFNATTSFTLPVNNPAVRNFTLYLTTPILEHGGREFILLGEPNKFVPFSPKRIFKIWQTRDFLAVTYSGVVGETVGFNYLNDRVLFQTTRVVDTSGCATFEVFKASSNSSIIPHNLVCLTH